MCKKDKCFNCHRFNKSKDILINFGNDFISDYVQNFLHNYFKVSDLTNFFFNIDISPIITEKDPIGVVKFDNKKVDSPPPKEEEENIFYFKSKKYRHYCKFI